MKNTINKTIRIGWYFCMVALFCISCAEDEAHKPIGSGNSTTPGAVKNVQVENIPGGAVFTYELPGNVDLQYVKAVYEYPGGTRESKASAYVNTLKLEGFGNTDAHTVRLYAVNRAEKTSEPFEVTIHPLTPPVQLVGASLSQAVDFGGFVIDFENPHNAEVAINIMVKDSLEDKFNDYSALYTSLSSGKYSVRGLPNKENDFGAYVVDRWNNFSDTLFFTATPWREDFLTKSEFKARSVYGDVGWNFHGGTPEKAWNENYSNGDYAHTYYPEEFPHRFTMDLGVTAKLSRFKFFQRPGDDVLYQHGAPKHYKVYGRADDPGAGNADDIFDGWTLLMECNSFKPSGLPVGQNSSEDVEFAALGEEFSFPRTIDAVRYLRFEMLESWSGMKCSTIGELSFWGEIQK